MRNIFEYVDENHYISHGVFKRFHKYLEKIKTGSGTRYFYSEDELKAYHAAKHVKKNDEKKVEFKATRPEGRVKTEPTGSAKEKWFVRRETPEGTPRVANTGSDIAIARQYIMEYSKSMDELMQIISEYRNTYNDACAERNALEAVIKDHKTSDSDRTQAEERLKEVNETIDYIGKEISGAKDEIRSFVDEYIAAVKDYKVRYLTK